MNILLFSSGETCAPLPRSDPRAEHLLTVLRRQPGDSFDAGLIDGPRGKGTLVAISPAALTLTFTWGESPPALPPLTLLVGLPRPQTARKILHDATTLGMRSLHFFAAARGEPSYAQSTLWTSGEWRRHLLAGAAQAFCTRLPEVTWGESLDVSLDRLPPLSPQAPRLALDNYEASSPLGASAFLPEAAIALALGPERGWTGAERERLRAAGFVLVHLGPRVLRAETAVTAALAIVKSRLGVM